MITLDGLCTFLHTAGLLAALAARGRHCISKHIPSHAALAHCCPVPPCLPQYEDPAEGLQALRTTLDVRRSLALDWLKAAAAERIEALAADRGKGAANGSGGGGSAKGRSSSLGRKAARVAAQHRLAAPAEVLDRLHSELHISKLQAATVWPVVLYVVSLAEPAVMAGVESMVRQNLVASMAATKENAQGGWWSGVGGSWTGMSGASCAAVPDWTV